MAITVSNESKNNLSVTNEVKGTPNLTIDEAVGTIDEAAGTIDVPKIAIFKETKNSLTVSNENKN